MPARRPSRVPAPHHTPDTEPAILATLRRLVGATGPSGSEEDVARIILDAARDVADEVSIDALGNVIATRRALHPDARRCVISAHMDEVGFRVRQVTPDGFLRLEKIGGIDDRILPAQRLWIRTERARLLGVIGTRSAHLLTDADRATVVPAAQLYVDIGARSAGQAADMGVQVGDPAGYVGDLTELGHGSGRYTAHALDDRAGCAALLTLLGVYRSDPPPVTIVAVFSVQEEVGLRGVTALARTLDADVALALDMTAADDTPDHGQPHLRVGDGPTVKVMDASTLAHPAVRRGLTAAASTAGVSAQPELLRGIGTDAGALQYVGGGVPAGAVSVVNRYTHSPVEVLDLADLTGAVTLLTAFLDALPTLPLEFLPDAR